MGSHSDARTTGPIGWLGGVVLWIVILGVLGVVTVAVAIPRLAGATPYTILTGSMRPTMPPGTLIVAKPVPVEQIGIGTAITYQLESGKPTVVTHRVVATGINGKGEHVFTTRGDANDVVDEEPVIPEQIKGEVWYSVPYLGYVNTLVTGQQRHIAMIAVVSSLLLYAAYMMTSGLRDQFRSRARGRRTAPS